MEEIYEEDAAFSQEDMNLTAPENIDATGSVLLAKHKQEQEASTIDFSGKLDIDHTFFDGIERDSISILKLADCGLSSGVVKDFTPLFPSFARLTHLDLSFNDFGFEGSQAIVEGGLNLRHLEKLFLRRCNLENFGAGVWGKALSSMCRLCHLDLGENNIGKTGMRMVAEGVALSWSLEVLVVGLNCFGDEGFRDLCEALKSNATIRELDVSQSGIGAVGCGWLGRVLAERNTLRKLTLNHNDIHTEGGRAIGKGLASNTGLLVLNVQGCSLGEGCGYIGQALEKNAMLLSLDLRENSLSRKGLKKLCTALKVNQTLAYLFLDKVGEEVVSQLSKALSVNQSLTRVAPEGVAISPNLQYLLNRNLRRMLAFHQVLERGNGAELQRLLSQQHFDLLTVSGVMKNPPLHLAVVGGAAVTEMLVQIPCVRAQIAFTNAINLSALDLASVEDQEGVLDVLAVSGFLHFAVSRGSLDLTFKLLGHGADINELDERGRTPLHIACSKDFPEMLDLLFENGADPAILFHGVSCLHLAAMKGNVECCLKILDRDPGLVTATSANENIETMIVGQYHGIDHPLELSGNATPFMVLGCTPLHVASQSGMADVCRVLIEAHANVESVTDDLSTPLHLASTKEVCAILLQAGAPIEALDDQGFTPAGRILKSGWIEAFEFMMENNANRNAALKPVTSLDLRYQLRDVLPFWIGSSMVEKLRVLAGNRLRSIPKQITSQGDDAVLQYLKDIGCPGNKATWEGFKVITLGKEGSGKTHIFNLLSKQRYTMNQSTDGIEIHSIRLKNSKIPCTWFDFGGQEVFYPTHQFFLTSQCVYLIVFSLTDPDYLQRLTYWLKCVEHFTSDPSRPAKVVIIGTHLDKAGALCQEERLECLKELIDGNTSVVAHAFVSCVEGGGVLASETIEKGLLLAAEQAGVTERVVPRSYVVVAQWVKEMRESMTHLSWDGLLQHFPGYDPFLLERSCAFLHDMGEIFFNQRVNLVCLDVKWLAKMFCCLITFRHGWVRNGIIKEEVLGHIWHDEGVTEQEIVSIMELFEAFNVVFYRKNDHCWVVPSMLPTNEAENVPRIYKIAQERTYSLKMLPLGVFGRLITRVQEWKSIEVLGMSKDALTIRDDLGQMAKVSCVNGTDIVLTVGRLPLKLMRANPAHRTSLLRHLVQVLQDIFKELFPHNLTTAIRCSITCPHCLAGIAKREDYTFLDYFECLRLTALGSKVFDCRDQEVSLNLLGDDISLDYVKLFNEDQVELDVEPFASGSFGKVYHGTMANGGESIVAKVLKFDISSDDGDMFSEFQQEVSMMARLDHPNIIKLHGIMVAPLRLIVEFCAKGDLFHALKGGKITSFALKKRLALDVAKGMYYLHNHDPAIAHRDLRSPNVFLFSLDASDESTPCAKVADLGLAVSVTSRLKQSLLTWQWMAPEAYLGQNYDERCDLYSFGILCWEICVGNGSVPFDSYLKDMKVRELIIQVMDHGLRPFMEPPELFHNDIGNLCEYLWQEDPSKRISFEECILALSKNPYMVDEERKKIKDKSGEMVRVAKKTPIKIQSSTFQYGEICAATRGSVIGKSLVFFGTESGGVYALKGFDNVIFENIAMHDSRATVMCVTEKNVVWCGFADGTIVRWKVKETYKVAKLEQGMASKSIPKLKRTVSSSTKGGSPRPSKQSGLSSIVSSVPDEPGSSSFGRFKAALRRGHDESSSGSESSGAGSGTLPSNVGTSDVSPAVGRKSPRMFGHEKKRSISSAIGAMDEGLSSAPSSSTDGSGGDAVVLDQLSKKPTPSVRRRGIPFKLTLKKHGSGDGMVDGEDEGERKASPKGKMALKERMRRGKSAAPDLEKRDERSSAPVIDISHKSIRKMSIQEDSAPVISPRKRVPTRERSSPSFSFDSSSPMVMPIKERSQRTKSNADAMEKDGVAEDSVVAQTSFKTKKIGFYLDFAQPHSGHAVSSVQVCSKYILTGDDGGNVVVWKDGEIAKQFKCAQPVSSICVLSDVLVWLTSGSDLYLVDLSVLEMQLLGQNDDGTLIAMIKSGPSRVWTCSVSILQIWDYSDCSCVKTITGDSIDKIRCLSLVNVHGSPTVWVGMVGEVWIFNADTGICTKKVLLDEGEVAFIQDAGEDIAFVGLTSGKVLVYDLFS